MNKMYFDHLKPIYSSLTIKIPLMPATLLNFIFCFKILITYYIQFMLPICL